jgi:hypothetical protein
LKDGFDSRRERQNFVISIAYEKIPQLFPHRIVRFFTSFPNSSPAPPRRSANASGVASPCFPDVRRREGPPHHDEFAHPVWRAPDYGRHAVRENRGQGRQLARWIAQHCALSAMFLCPDAASASCSLRPSRHPASTIRRRISTSRQEHQVGRFLGIPKKRLARRANLRAHGQATSEVQNLARAHGYGKVR